MNEGVRKAVNEACWHEEVSHILRQVAQLVKVLTDDTDYDCEISVGEKENPVMVTGCITNPATGKQIVILYYDSASTEKKFTISLAGASESMLYKFKSSVDDRGYTYSEMLSMLKDRKFFWSFI